MQKITVAAKGEVAQLADTINTMVDRLSSFAAEVTRVAREVGTDGKLGGQAEVSGVSGTWRDLTESVNLMASNLTDQVRSIASVSEAVARGDLTQKITVEASGEVAELADTINEMTDTLAMFADQVTGVAREVGTEGILGGQAQVPNVAGTWKDLTESVNLMAANLTDQVRNISTVAGGGAGDLSQKITVEARGEVAELAETLNEMTDTLAIFADQVTGVAREVGTEGKLGGQAEVPNVAGTWKDLTDSVNLMAGNLTSQVRNIAQVTTAVANGDLAQQITVDVKGEISTLKRNHQHDGRPALELRRRGHARGARGRHRGHPGRPGRGQGRLRHVARPDRERELHGRQPDQAGANHRAGGDGGRARRPDPEDHRRGARRGRGARGHDQRDDRHAGDVRRPGDGRRARGGHRGHPGRPGRGAERGGHVEGPDREREPDGVEPDRSGAKHRRGRQAVAAGDLTQKITVEARGEVAELADTINEMTDTLAIFADQVTGVAREVGTEGKLGGQAEVPNVAGTWKDLTDSVNLIAGNLTDQVRNIAQVTTAVARGDLSQKITADAKGEILELKNTINTMVDQLSSFADEVTRVAREVGTEGKLGGQAEVKGVSGTWRDLTENVNLMAGNLTDQVRNIAQVDVAVAEGDLSQKISVEAQGRGRAPRRHAQHDGRPAPLVRRRGHARGARGRHRGQARRPGRGRGVSGTWRGLTENVNLMATNLTDQVRNIAQVTTAVANGDLSKKITVDARGEILELKDTINTMVDQLARSPPR